MDLSTDTTEADCESHRMQIVKRSIERESAMWQALLVLKFKEIIKLGQTRANYTKTVMDICELV